MISSGRKYDDEGRPVDPNHHHPGGKNYQTFNEDEREPGEIHGQHQNNLPRAEYMDQQ